MCSPGPSSLSSGLQGGLREGAPERTQDLGGPLRSGGRGQPHGGLQRDLLHPRRRGRAQARWGRRSGLGLLIGSLSSGPVVQGLGWLDSQNQYCQIGPDWTGNLATLPRPSWKVPGRVLGLPEPFLVLLVQDVSPHFLLNNGF